ncbi:toll/interleukin-1 receptor domain-containing protein [Paenibacillus bouchesdurhonensis]|uniref:toll/interleukin-1 receptor domain-containing protein n=1 Tax=Paenibacillus bouchesdurhonensis TaxID=1870990 RepID=UPI000DA61C54|nr:TIR domain-containing protein [Paenibacillus bouchesdurhonensis]
MHNNNNKGIIVNGGQFHANVVSVGNINMNNHSDEPQLPIQGSCSGYKYDVAFSFAGEDRSYVEIIAKELKTKGIKVFYDEFEELSLWGKDLFVYLDQLYQNSATYCVMFISEIYTKKAWCDLERNSAMYRQYLNGEYILPVRLDGTEIHGITDRHGYLEAKNYSPVQLAEAIITKLSKTRGIK